MKAIFLEAFGSEEKLQLGDLPKPKVDADDVLIKVHYAGLGQWDPFEREGGYDRMLGLNSQFPYILGSEGMGIVEEVGSSVSQFKAGDRVYASGFLNPKGGFYAEYVSVNENFVLPAVRGYADEELAGIAGVGLTALRGLEDVLKLKKDDTILIHGASGAMGHIALQFAKCMGAKTIALASGKDGVEMCRNLGADLVIDGRDSEDIKTLKNRTSDLIDYIFLTAPLPKELMDEAILKKGAKLAYPYGVMVDEDLSDEYELLGFYGDPDKDILSRLSDYLDKFRIRVEVSKVFDMNEIKEAHKSLSKHHLGKMVLEV